MDGILGIGRGDKGESGVAAPQIMDVLSNNRLIGSKLYGIHLSRGTDNLNDGELNFGQVNKDRFTGDLNWNSCLDNDAGFWEIGVADAGVNGKSLGLSGRTAIIDTGTSFILMPAPDALNIHTQIPGFKQDGETFSVPCDSAAVIQFSFNKQVYNISTEDWRGAKLDNGLCRSKIVGRQTFGERQWLVGDVFLKNVYAVFDFEGGRVGFGVVREGGSESATSSVARPSGVSATVGVTGTSQTEGVVAGGASPTGAAGTQAQGGNGTGGLGGKISVSLFGLSVAISVSISLFI